MQFFTVLNQAIENRSLNMAQRKVIDQSLHNDCFVCPIHHHLNEQGRLAVGDLLEQCSEVIPEEYAKLPTDMQQFRNRRSTKRCQPNMGASARGRRV